MDIVEPTHVTEAHRWMGPETAHDGISVLALEPGQDESADEWLLLSKVVPVGWLWLAAVEDPLVQARAMLERDVDAGVATYLVTTSEAARTAMLVAAHQPDDVQGVFVVLGRASCGEDVRQMLREHDVPVFDTMTRRDAAWGATRGPLSRMDVVEAVTQAVGH